MYRDMVQWIRIRRLVLEQNVPKRQVAREAGISRGTLRKILEYEIPPAYPARDRRFPQLGPYTSSLRRMINENATLPPSARLSYKAMWERIKDEEGFPGSYSTVRDYASTHPADEEFLWENAYLLLTTLGKPEAIDFLYLLSRADPPVVSMKRAQELLRNATKSVSLIHKKNHKEERKEAAFEWMHCLLQKKINLNELMITIGDVPELNVLLKRLYGGRLSDRNRAMARLAKRHGVRMADTCKFLGITKLTYLGYQRLFAGGGSVALFARKVMPNRKFDDDTVKQAVFSLLHEPPSNYGLNRTTWIMNDLSRVLGEKGHPVCRQVIQRITKEAGYRWRKARVVLTSADPAYSEKLAHIQSLLSALGPDEAFFSIDEFGPFAVRSKPGLALVPPGEQRTVPQWEKSRGCLIMTAALELSGNQITHFYSSKKNTDEMIRMMDCLVMQYADRKKLYLSWDAASWHISKRLQAHIETHNAAVRTSSGPLVETAPLPAGAQFLNVIEAVFSGMARAIIHNSNYKSVEEAKIAIGRYIDERNAHFREHPRRAGRKIWGAERGISEFSDASNCKDPRYR